MVGVMYITGGMLLCIIFGPVLVERSWLPEMAFDVWLGLILGVAAGKNS